MIESYEWDWSGEKCRWAAYFGGWPAWVDEVVDPRAADVALLARQWQEAVGRGEFEWVKARCRAMAGVQP